MIELNPTKNWMKFEGDKIPSSLELEPIIFDYASSLAFSENVFNFVVNQAFWTTIISKGEFKYLAHHYTKDEFEELLREGGFKGSNYYKQTVFTTQSGNKINGHVFLAIKN